MKKIFIFVVVVVLLYLAQYLLNKYARVISSDGHESPYFKGLLLSPNVYYRFWVGDGLGGSYKYNKLLNSKKNNFSVVDVYLNDGEPKDPIPFGLSNSVYYFKDIPLPFDPTQQNLKRTIFVSRDDIFLITKTDVYFVNYDSVKIVKDAKADSFKSVDASDFFSRIFTDGDKKFEVIYVTDQKLDGTSRSNTVVKEIAL